MFFFLSHRFLFFCCFSWCVSFSLFIYYHRSIILLRVQFSAATFFSWWIPSNLFLFFIMWYLSWCIPIYLCLPGHLLYFPFFHRCFLEFLFHHIDFLWFPVLCWQSLLFPPHLITVFCYPFLLLMICQIYLCNLLLHATTFWRHFFGIVVPPMLLYLYMHLSQYSYFCDTLVTLYFLAWDILICCNITWW